MEKIILDYLNNKKEVTELLKEYVKNKRIPLEERWILFLSSKLGVTNDYYVVFNTLNEDFYNDTGINRYENITVEWLLDLLIDHSIEESEITRFFINKLDSKKLTKETYLNASLDLFKEEVLEKFIYSFNYDW